ncbi:hypothetical protein QJS66_08880 [Kocuria rhizophila]|nr:hypothetical protein QJS66_08880 [Kocuria rhizophila]
MRLITRVITPLLQAARRLRAGARGGQQRRAQARASHPAPPFHDAGAQELELPAGVANLAPAERRRARRCPASGVDLVLLHRRSAHGQWPPP